jgi:hypothetical protein
MGYLSVHSRGSITFIYLHRSIHASSSRHSEGTCLSWPNCCQNRDCTLTFCYSQNGRRILHNLVLVSIWQSCRESMLVSLQSGPNPQLPDLLQHPCSHLLVALQVVLSAAAMPLHSSSSSSTAKDETRKRILVLLKGTGKPERTYWKE